VFWRAAPRGALRSACGIRGSAGRGRRPLTRR
jgi:hypothetical protein